MEIIQFSMHPISFNITGWQSWPLAENATPLPASLRRRVTPMGQHALAAAWQLPETSDARLILSSRHGEFSRTLSLLESVVNKEELSPADFTLSVHHALIGLLSIVKGNRKGHTAIAAGDESFCFGMMEAAACLHENPAEPVVLIHFDDLLPGPFAAFDHANEQPMAVAIALTAQGQGIACDMAMASQSPSTTVTTKSHAQDFINFIASDATSLVTQSRQRRWQWTRHAHR